MHLIDVLRGKHGERVERWGHEALGVFGIGAELDEPAWRSVFRQLVALGLARVDHDAHGALRLTEASRAVLKGEQAVQMRRVPARAARRARRAAPADVAPADAQLLQALKEWRRSEARSQGVPAYVILHDSTLAEIARARPRDLAALAGLGGIGAKKLERYGSALLQLVK